MCSVAGGASLALTRFEARFSTCHCQLLHSGNVVEDEGCEDQRLKFLFFVCLSQWSGRKPRVSDNKTFI